MLRQRMRNMSVCKDVFTGGVSVLSCSQLKSNLLLSGEFHTSSASFPRDGDKNLSLHTLK